jgi:putative ABC transport system substrate-binding protein
MRRRAFLGLVGVTAAWPVATLSAQPRTSIIGLLYAGAEEASKERVAAFRRGLADTGYVEGKNLGIEYRWGQGNYDRLTQMAADLAGRQVSLIAATGSITSVMAAKAATTTIPIVFSVGADPIRFGLVDSLNRPTGNITGATFFGGSALEAKRLALLRELVPGANVIAYLVNSRNPSRQAQAREVEDAARLLGCKIQVLQATTENEIDQAFVRLNEMGAQGLLVAGDAFFASRSSQLALLAIKHAIPSVYQLREYVAAGGLMSYGTSILDAYHQAGLYAGRILHGEKPIELPIVQSTRFELVINTQTAKVLGIQVPSTLLARADEVVE